MQTHVRSNTITTLQAKCDANAQSNRILQAISLTRFSSSITLCSRCFTSFCHAVLLCALCALFCIWRSNSHVWEHIFLNFDFFIFVCSEKWLNINPTFHSNGYLYDSSHRVFLLFFVLKLDDICMWFMHQAEILNLNLNFNSCHFAF